MIPGDRFNVAAHHTPPFVIPLACDTPNRITPIERILYDGSAALRFSLLVLGCHVNIVVIEIPCTDHPGRAGNLRGSTTIFYRCGRPLQEGIMASLLSKL